MLVQRNGEWVKVAQELYKTQTAKRKYEKREYDLRKQLKELSENKPAMGGKYLWLCEYSNGHIDYEAIPQLKGIELDQYRKEQIERWKLRKV